MHLKKAIVIGSGVAGISAAIRLAVHGYQVDIFEANGFPGGKLSMFEKQGYRFDAGPSLFTQPQNINELFELAQEPVENYFTYKPVDTACKYFFENGKIINAYADAALFAEEVAHKSGEKNEAVKKYLTRSGKLYENVGDTFLNHSLHKRSTWFNRRVFKALKTIRFPYLFFTLNRYNSNHFSSTEAVRIFNRYATYNGSNPYKAPGMLSLIPHLEYNEGVFYPAGGMISITNALYNLALKKGVRFNFNAPVQRIIHHEGKIIGVVANDQNIHAPVVISNADVYFTYKNLLNHLPKSKRLLKKERSSSAVIFYWGIKKQFPSLGLHNILFSENYKEEFNGIFNKKIPYGDSTVYINITSRLDESHAPAGKENWFVMINVPANHGQDWDNIKQQIRSNTIKKINRILQTDIEPLIETEETLDPISIESKTGSFMGSLYGSSSNSRLAAFFRPANFTSYIRGLYFCGGTVHPGGGIPLCFKSAKIATELIVKDERHRNHS